MKEVIERVPPHNLEAEQAVLAAMMVDRDAIARVSQAIDASGFYRQAHSVIFEAMIHLYERGEPVDLITVRDQLGPRLDEIGGYGYLVDLAASIPTTAHAEYYAKIVGDKALLRNLIRVGTEIVAQAFAEEDDVEEVLDAAERNILEVGQRRQSGSMTPIKDVIHEAFETIEARYADKDSLLGATTGFYDLDHMLSGFQPSDLLILAARPAMGKCLPAWTRVVDPDTGARLTLEECVKRRLPRVHGIGENGIVRPVAIAAWIDSGIKPCYRVTTRLGRQVEVTGHHPFLTVTGWTPLSDLHVGDKIGLPRRLDAFGTCALGPAEAEPLAAAALTGGAIPPAVWTATRDGQRAFLAALHGEVPAEGPPAPLTLATERLARDVQHLLTRFGIVAAIAPTQATAEAPADDSTWTLAVTERGAVRNLRRVLDEALAPAGAAPHEPGTRQVIGTGAVLADPRFARAASPDLVWDPIVAIAPIGEHQVYDLTVPDGANFIAEDVCVHNTSLALNFCRNVAVETKKATLLYSLEMSKEQLVQRLLCAEAGIDSHRLRTGYLAEQDWGKLTHAIGVLSEAPIYIDDSAALTVAEMRSKARRVMAEEGELGLIMVDYLQLMSSGSKSTKDDNRAAAMGAISRGLKQLARELRVPVIALSQLSRAVESRPNKRPMLSDLRESGCLTGDTLVFLPATGTYRRIDALMGQSDFDVMAVDPATWRLEPRRVVHAFPTGTKPVYRLTTRLGRTIRATGNHKFLAIDGWQRLDELGGGQLLAMPRRLPCLSQASMADAEVGLLGHLIGDGCTLPRQPVHYTTNDPILAETVVELARESFGDRLVPRIEPSGNVIQVYLAASAHLTHGVRNPIAEWLDELGVFGLRSYEKFVPELVFAQPIASIALFLRHLWSTDGCIHMSGGKKHYANVYYASSSERLARDVQALLLRLEVNATLRQVPQGEKGRDQFQVWVSGREEIMRFLDTVGGLGANKSAQEAAMRAYFAERQPNTNRDALPREVWTSVVKPADRAARVATVLESRPLADLATSDVYWDEIVSIVPDGEEQVYDLTVDGLHNFVANDMIVHNSIEQDADIVMFIYRDEYYNPDTDKKSTAEVIIAKHRNGPVGHVELYFEKNLTKFQSISTRQFTGPP